MKYLLWFGTALGISLLYLYLGFSHFYNSRPLLTPTPTTAGQTIVIGPLLNPTQPKTLRYTVLGDSLSAGTGATSPSSTFPHLLAEHLSNARLGTVTVTTLATPGATTADVLRTQLPKLNYTQPNLVTLLVGINDLHNHVSLNTFKQNLIVILNELSRHNAQVQVLTIPYLGSPRIARPPYRMYFDWQTKRYNRVITEVVNNSTASLVDLYTLTHAIEAAEPAYYSPDGFHPSDLGYTFWANSLYDTSNY